MKKRLYFLVPDEEIAKKVTDRLRSYGIDDKQIHAVAKEDKYPLAQDIPEADITDTSDLMNALKRGATVGGAAGLFAGLAVVAIAPLAPLAMGGVILGLTAAGMVAGSWGASLVGISVPNTDLDTFTKAIDEGEILLLVDTTPEQEARIEQVVRQADPKAVITSGALKPS
jgi:hypothetical protein